MATTTSYADDDARWAAGRSRDRAADGVFFTCVRTTGVYCLPSCSGRPLRKNVEYHPTAEAARAAGFRPCLRCRPDAERETLTWAIGDTELGLALVAMSPAGLRLAILGDDRAALVADLNHRFPQARLVEDGSGLADILSAIAARIVRPDAAPDLRLDDRGTELQRAVWQALRAIPSGQTVSYAQVARTIGRPTASRAVAQACAANPLAVITPCHRVVRADGGLSGYRWGVARKQALLAREGAA